MSKITSALLVFWVAAMLLAACSGEAGDGLPSGDADEERVDGDLILDGDIETIEAPDGDVADGDEDADAILDGDAPDGDVDSADDCRLSGCDEGVCDEQSGACVECAQDVDCPPLYRCDKSRRICYFAGCEFDRDCGDGEVCQRASGQCVGCIADSQCAGGICDRTQLVCVASNCEDDAKEPNDDAREAVDWAGGSLSKLAVCPPDRDWFRLNAAAGDRLAFKVDCDGPLQIELMHADAGDALIRETIQGAWSHAVESAPLGGEYLLAISTAGSERVQYSLALERTRATATCEDDGLEENDGRNSARTLGQGSATYSELVLCPQDPDWYAFNLDAGDSLSVSIENLDAAQAVLFDPELIELARRQLPDTLAADSLHRSGTHYLRIIADDAADRRTYTMAVEIDHRQQCSDDRLEPNDTPATLADGMAIGEQQLTLCPNDADWFAFDLAAGDVILLEADLSPQHARLRMTDERGIETLLVAEASEAGQALLGEVVQAGRYLAAVEPLGVDAPLTYHLGVEIEAAPVCGDDELEPNDTYATATELQSGEFVEPHICSGDPDWFRFVATVGDTIRLFLLFDDTYGDLDMYLYAPDGYLVAAAESTDSDEILALTAALGGVYYVLVKGYDGAANDYELGLTLDGAQPQCTDDVQEPNDTIDDAVLVDPAYDGNLKLCSGDEDWFAMWLAKDGGFAAEITFSHAEGDLDMYLYDANGDLLAASDSESDDEYLELAKSAVEDLYYLRVVGYNGAGANYHLSVIYDAP